MEPSCLWCCVIPPRFLSVQRTDPHRGKSPRPSLTAPQTLIAWLTCMPLSSVLDTLLLCMAQVVRHFLTDYAKHGRVRVAGMPAFCDTARCQQH